MLDLDYISYLIKEVILPLVSVILVGVTLFVAWRKELFTLKNQLPKSERSPVEVTGHHNTIHLAPSEMQKLAYDATKFDEYHAQSISQCRVSFWFSIIFATIGFSLIATSVFAYSDKSGYLGVIAGAVVEAVAALFFVQSNKARKLMSEFFDRLRQDRKLEESLNLCDAIDDEFVRNSLRLKLSLFFAGVEESNGIESEIINLARGNNTAERRRR